MTLSVTNIPVPTPDKSTTANDNAADDDVLTVEQVTKLLRLGRNAVYDAVGRGEIPHRRIGKRIRFSRRALMRWLASWSLQGAKEGT